MRKSMLTRMLIIFGMCLFIAGCTKSQKADKNPEEYTNFSKVLDMDANNEGKKTIALTDGYTDEALTVVGEDEPGYGTLGVNIKSDQNQVLLCKDPVYDIVYYVNYGIDYYIYRLKDNKSELVVKLPAKRLFCIGGKLYFILESYDIYEFQDINNGAILCYDPVSGEVSKITDDSASTMFVYEDGIYYYVNLKREDLGEGKFIQYRTLYFYSFRTEKREEIKDPYITPYKWKEYHFTYEVEAGEETYERSGKKEKITRTVGIGLETLDKAKRIELPINSMLDHITIVGDNIYCTAASETLEILNINTMEKKEVPLANPYYNDFTICNNMLYVESMLQIDPETGQQRKIEAQNPGEVIHELYTDGNNLYGICGPKEGMQYGVMRRIELEENPENAIVLQNQKGTSYETGGLAYKTLPMGEEQTN